MSAPAPEPPRANLVLGNVDFQVFDSSSTFQLDFVPRRNYYIKSVGSTGLSINWP